MTATRTAARTRRLRKRRKRRRRTTRLMSKRPSPAGRRWRRAAADSRGVAVAGVVAAGMVLGRLPSRLAEARAASRGAVRGARRAESSSPPSPRDQGAAAARGRPAAGPVQSRAGGGGARVLPRGQTAGVAAGRRRARRRTQLRRAGGQSLQPENSKPNSLDWTWTWRMLEAPRLASSRSPTRSAAR